MVQETEYCFKSLKKRYWSIALVNSWAKRKNQRKSSTVETTFQYHISRKCCVQPLRTGAYSLDICQAGKVLDLDEQHETRLLRQMPYPFPLQRFTQSPPSHARDSK